MRQATRLVQGYKVIKCKTDEGPLPNMSQYYLQNDQAKTISFWNDVPIDFHQDCVTCGIEIPK